MKNYICILLLAIISLQIFANNHGVNSESVRIGLILEGQISDLGINYNINAGLILAESLIDITASKVISSVDTEEATAEAIKFLVQSGYNMIITSSLVHATPAMVISKDYIGTYFLIYTPFDLSSNTGMGFHDRIAVYYENLVSPHYVLGYLVGVAAQELAVGKVGMVVPGPPTQNYYTSNAFYAGLSEANATVEFMVVATSSYNDEDTSAGAIEILKEQNIDLITQSQTTMQVAVPIMYLSKLALGTNGFPQSMIYGNKIVQSVIANYSVPFIEFANRILNDNWTANPTFFGDFANGYLALDEYSYLVGETAREQINAKVQKLAGQSLEESDYLCNDYNTQTYGKKCLPYVDMIMDTDKLYSGVSDLGYYAVPTSEVYETGSINRAFKAVAGIEIGICLIVFLVVLIFFRHNINFTYSTIPFTGFVLLGASMVGVAIIFWNLRELSTSVCNARIWMASLGYTFLLGMIIVKNTLIHRKFKSMIKTKTDKLSPIPFKRVAMFFTPLLLTSLILLAVYTGIGEVQSKNSLGLDGIGKYEYTQTCYNNQSGNVIIYIILLYHGLQLLYGCFITWKTRVNDLEEFAEVHDFASALYLITFCSFIIVPLMAGIQVHRNRETIISACGIFTSFSCVLIVFGAKFWKIYKPIEDDGLPQIKLQNMRNKGSSSSGGTKSSRSKSVHSKSSPSTNTRITNTTATKDIATSVNIQNFVNPIESQSRNMAEKVKEKERVQEILTAANNNNMVESSNNNAIATTSNINESGHGGISSSQNDLVQQ